MQSLFCMNRPCNLSTSNNNGTSPIVRPKYSLINETKRYSSKLPVRDRSRLLKFRDEGPNARIHSTNCKYFLFHQK